MDTNVLISGIFWKGIPGSIMDHWVEGKFELIASVPILDEYKRILRRIGAEIDPALSETWIKVIIEKTHVVALSASVDKWSRDVDDDKFIHCSLAGRADYLVTGDKDLLVLREEFSFKIVNPRKFLEGLDGAS